MIAAAVGCGGDGSQEVASEGITGSAGGSADSGSTASSGSAKTTDSSAGDGTKGPIFDVAPNIDLGGEPPIELTCANIVDYPATGVGCEFYGADLPILQNSGWPYGIGVGNPGQVAATVVIEDMRGPGGALREITTVMLAAGESTLVSVNGTGGVLDEQDHVVVPGANAMAAFHVRSDVPITAMQINPVGGGPSHVSEASLLLPVNSLGTSYFAIGYQPISLSTGNGYVAVVGTEDGTTITTTGGTATIDAYDVQVFATEDPTGFFVGSDAPVAVFSGSRCSNIPEGVVACDHLQEQVMPASAWGTKYVGARHPARITTSNNSPEPVFWRVVAGVDDTTIALNPPVAGAEIVLSTAGSYFEFSTAESFLAEGDHPFMLVQYMSSCRNVVPAPLNPDSPCDEPQTGDPSMIQMPPVDQWIGALPFLTDTSYPRDFAVFIREKGTTVDLACLGVVPDDHFTAIPGTMYEVGSVDLDAFGGGEGACVDGAQYVSASAPIGVLVGGVDWATSYGYPGGLSFTGLWDPPTVPPG